MLEVHKSHYFGMSMIMTHRDVGHCSSYESLKARLAFVCQTRLTANAPLELIVARLVGGSFVCAVSNSLPFTLLMLCLVG